MLPKVNGKEVQIKASKWLKLLVVIGGLLFFVVQVDTWREITTNYASDAPNTVTIGEEGSSEMISAADSSSYVDLPGQGSGEQAAGAGVSDLVDSLLEVENAGVSLGGGTVEFDIALPHGNSTWRLQGRNRGTSRSSRSAGSKSSSSSSGQAGSASAVTAEGGNKDVLEVAVDGRCPMDFPEWALSSVEAEGGPGQFPRGVPEWALERAARSQQMEESNGGGTEEEGGGGLMSSVHVVGNSEQDVVVHQVWDRGEGAEEHVVDLKPMPPDRDFVDDGVPKVALMFLLARNLPQEALWRLFFQAAGSLRLKSPPPLEPETLVSDLLPPGKCMPTHVNKTALGFKVSVPTHYVPKKLEYDIARLPREVQAYWQFDNPRDLYYAQNLFTAYVHLPPGADLPEDSIFAGRVIDERVKTEYAQQSLARAELALMRAALRNPLNQRFVLLSESCVPIYPPEVYYLQLLSEDTARLDAQISNSHDKKAFSFMDHSLGIVQPVTGLTQTNKAIVYRPQMTPASPLPERKARWWYSKLKNFIRRDFWKFSSQWSALTRPTVKVLLADGYVGAAFENHCFYSNVRGKPRGICIADEHQFATTIAAYGLSNLTDGFGWLTYYHRTSHTWSPITYKEINSSLFSGMRNYHETCDALSAIESAKMYFDYVPSEQ